MFETKKLIEVALPLEAINRESAREKNIRFGHPSTLHLWWARRPLATCRAVLFSSIVDDPGSYIQDEQKARFERKRIFGIIERLIKWENINDQVILNEAKLEIVRSIARSKKIILPVKMKSDEVQKFLDYYSPPVLDPFCGGGSIPLEAQRLGLKATGSDLNPVAVVIAKALTEIPPKFFDRPPVNPDSQKRLKTENWNGSQGLIEDIRYYGKFMRNEALKRIGYLFPPAKLPDGTEATVIANLWTHTVKCPNPACGAIMPLLTSFILSSRKGVYIIPKTNNKTITYSIDTAPPKNIKDPKRGMKRGMSGIFECIFCGTITTRDYVSNEGKAKRIGIQPIAIIVDGPKGRLYLPPDAMKYPSDIPKPDLTGLEYELARNPRDVWCRNFGLTTPVDLFTPRQLLLLKTYSGLVYEMRERVIKDGQGQQTHPDYKTIEEGGTGLNAYADAVALYLGLAVSRLSDNNSLLVIWSQSRDQLIHTFGRQALPMVWDFAESNTFSMSAGDISITLDSIIKSIQALPINITAPGKIEQMDAKSIAGTDIKSLISTDPPYYDNIGYADLSDFFYVWLRLSLGKIFRNLFSTVLVPKEQELVAIPYRFGNNKLKAQIYFKEGLEKTFLRFHNILDQNYPMTIFYAFKQAEIEEEEISHNIIISSTGWETMLESIISTGYIITGTWPMRTERGVRMVSLETNALASSIVLVCRPRLSSAPIATRREFLTIIRKELPMALKKLQEGNIAPVDLAQAAIGPGMEIFSRYSKVIEANGIPMNIRTALQIINQELETFLKYEEVDIDSDTQFLIAWFEQYGINEGPFGTADVLARAKNTSVEGLTKTGALTSKGGKVALRSRNDYDPKWDPATDSRLTLWECTQYLIKRLKEGGESAAADLFSRLGTGKSEDAKNLAYRLYRTCEYKGWMDEARAYNELVIAWPEIQKAAAGLSGEGPQKKLDVGERGNNK